MLLVAAADLIGIKANFRGLCGGGEGFSDSFAETSFFACNSRFSAIWGCGSGTDFSPTSRCSTTSGDDAIALLCVPNWNKWNSSTGFAIAIFSSVRGAATLNFQRVLSNGHKLNVLSL